MNKDKENYEIKNNAVNSNNDKWVKGIQAVNQIA